MLDRDYFSVKFRGNIYHDAWRDDFGDIYFGGNTYVYKPEIPGDRLRSYPNYPVVEERTSAGSNGSYVTRIKKYKTDIEILN